MLSRENGMQGNRNNVLDNSHSFQYILFPTLVCDDEKIPIFRECIGKYNWVTPLYEKMYHCELVFVKGSLCSLG